ncbi:hypothetical protein JTE90_005641 [Oedothorax gibbosus]|uniref:Uncharacterized protein n=1 Tax=Oedothorax gibbosus TaxID=931172 RepID=A0AAV6UHJ4_9ARAC|nr:hypothetical protein JTE90_005641 [Oedothorax gibbosus]
MAFNPPKLFLRSSLSEEDSLNLSSDIFKISAPSGKSGLMWSVFLSYLIISSKRCSTWQKGYESVLGIDSEISNLLEERSIRCRPDRKSIRSIVYRFNPFRNRSSIYYNQKMIDAFRLFKLKLKTFGSVMNTNNEHFRTDWKLKTAAEMLRCQIVIITEHSGTSKVTCEPPFPTETECQKLVIFLEKNVPKGEKLVDVYGFGLSLEHSARLRLDALGNLLKFARVEFSDIVKIKRKFNLEDNFLQFLLDTQQCDISMGNLILEYVSELENLLDTDAQINGQVKDNVINNLSKQRNLLTNVFEDILSENELPFGNFSEINRYLEDVKSARWFTDEEISDIQTLVTKYLERSNDALEDIEYKNRIIFENIDELVELAQKEPVKSILLKIKNNDEWDYLEEKMLTFLNRKLECLLNRIKHLKEILIDEDEEIASLWEWGKSPGILKHTRFLMGQRYMLERDVRASLEMLLFDCMNILFKKKSDLEVLWTKATNLFSGANLRDVLSHGNTALEVIGGLLDPEDLPSQLIDKIVELIEDEEGLRDMSDTWRDTKGDCQKELQEIVDKQILKKKSKAEQDAAKKKWTEYLSLLPS